ncbi:MAG: HEPN domain-containing protein [Niveispirillum sp.]|uniref:HEPN domain-containing protein n=1 Tax=Niveispirillum sp. TaxID=1917217 RepID=UPI0040359215
MLNAKSVFNRNIAEARQNTALFDYISAQVRVPTSFDDLLRAQIVIAVAAFDKLMHDVIRIGMCQTFAGTRPATKKFNGETVSLQTLTSISLATMPPKENIFENAVVEKLKILSFQHPDKISDGLSLIWPEKHKWAIISKKAGYSEEYMTKKLVLISTRRNAIVHESDMNPLTNEKTPVSRAECDDITNFIARCGNAIVDLVINPSISPPTSNVNSFK